MHSTFLNFYENVWHAFSFGKLLNTAKLFNLIFWFPFQILRRDFMPWVECIFHHRRTWVRKRGRICFIQFRSFHCSMVWIRICDQVRCNLVSNLLTRGLCVYSKIGLFVRVYGKNWNDCRVIQKWFLGPLMISRHAYVNEKFLRVWT